MTLLAYNDAMSTGVAELDTQHKEIIRRVNELHQAMLNGQGRDELGKTLSYLVQYAGMHFAKEEACMTRYHCPAAAANVQAHRAFVQKVTAFQQRLQAEGPTTSLVIALKKELADWLVGHICKVDTRLADSVGGTRRAA